MAVLDPSLLVLPYQEALAAYLKTEESETWAWFASAETQSSYAESLRLDLLKHTYRLDPATYPDLSAAINDAKLKLGLDVPVTVYQSQTNHQLNAALYYLPGEAHIVLQGDVLQLLDAAELRGVIGHELAHYLLWSSAEGQFLTVDRIAQALANDPRAEPSYVESARLMRLYTEIYADRGALEVTNDPTSVITGLIKMHTGLRQVDAASYLRQAEEVFARAHTATEGLSHPEAFIRARAVMLWTERAPAVDAEIARMIQGETSLDQLDLLGQRRLTDFTKRWIQLFLRPAWFRTDAVRGQAKLFFADFDFATEGHRDDPLLDQLRGAGTSIRDYFCYLLLDFSAVDADLELEPLKVAFALTSELGWDERFETLVVKELKIKKREAQRMRAEARTQDAPANAESTDVGPGTETSDE
jgi:Peptidase family M48